MRNRTMNRQNLLQTLTGTKRQIPTQVPTNLDETNYHGWNLAKSSQSVFDNYNVQQGSLFIDSAITTESANTFVQDLRFYINSQMFLAEELRQPVTIYINTPGGYVHEAWTIINAIRSCPLETTGIVMGTAASAGVPILLACDHRIAFEYAELMIHSLSGGTYGTYKDMEEQWERTQQIQDKLNSFIVENSEVTFDYLIDCEEKKQDKYLTPIEAKELGIVDEVIGNIKEWKAQMQEQTMKMMGDIQEQMEGLSKEQKEEDKQEKIQDLKKEDVEYHGVALESEDDCDCDKEDCKCGDDCKCKEKETEVLKPEVKKEEETEVADKTISDLESLIVQAEKADKEIAIHEESEIRELGFSMKISKRLESAEWALLIYKGEAILTIGESVFEYDRETNTWIFG